jgi:urease accessory protein UreF
LTAGPHAPGPGESGDLGLLRLLQVFDSQFPVGAFAHSGGLETYAARGGSLPEVRGVLRAQVALGWGRSELAAAWLAWHAAATPDADAELDRLGVALDAMKVVPAIRDMSLGLGRRTLDLLRRLHPGRLPALSRPHHAIVVGVAGRCLELEPQAQAVLIELQPQLATAVARAIDDPEGSLFTCTPALDLRSHQQASLHTRLFQS